MNQPNTFIMEGTDPRIAGSVYAVAATNFERDTLQAAYKGRVEWIDDPAPLVCEVSKIVDFPILYRFDWAKINGKLVMFYQSASDVASKPSVMTWLRMQGVAKFTDAMQFHNVILTITDGVGLVR